MDLGTVHGYIGSLESWEFELLRLYADYGEHVIGSWILTAPLMRDRRPVSGPDPEELKAEAERWLEEFVSSLGAVFPDEAVQDSGWCPACWHMWSLHTAGGCTAKVYPAHSLTGKPCPCEHAAGEERGEEAGAGPGEGRQ